MNRTVKNILIAVFVPTALAAVYFGYQYYSRKQKEKKILDEVQNKLEKSKTQIAGLNEQVISKWKEALKELKAKEFDAFFNYFMVTIPYGKVQFFGYEKPIWIFESSNPNEFKVAAEEGIKAISGKEIEKLFQAITPDK